MFYRINSKLDKMSSLFAMIFLFVYSAVRVINLTTTLSIWSNPSELIPFGSWDAVALVFISCQIGRRIASE